MNLEQTLTNFGFNQKQAKIYLACLSLGSGPVQAISKLASLPRTTCYEVLDELQTLGAVSSFQKKKIKHFSAVDPHQLVQLAKERVELLEKAVPNMLAMYAENKVRPSVRYYQGVAGMKVILNEVLDEATEVLAFSSATDLFDVLDDEFPNFVKKRLARKIPMRVILRDSPKARERQILGRQELREVRLIPATYEYHGAVFIWKDKIAMFSLVQKAPAALVVESVDLAAVQRAVLQVIWTSLSPKPKPESRFV